MKRNLRNQVITKLELWGHWLSKSVNAGYSGKNPIVGMMEYGCRTSGGRFDIHPTYEIERDNQNTHNAIKFVEMVDPVLFQIAYYEYVYHHEIDPDFPRGRLKMKLKQILKRLDMKKSKYYEAREKLYCLMLGRLAGNQDPCDSLQVT